MRTGTARRSCWRSWLRPPPRCSSSSSLPRTERAFGGPDPAHPHRPGAPMSTAATVFSFAPSAFVPLALGFFGLGTGCLIYGPGELLGFPRRDRAVDITTGIWGIWMPGFLQFLTGVILFVG